MNFDKCLSRHCSSATASHHTSMMSVNQITEAEMDRLLQEYGVLESDMRLAEKKELIEILEISKISAKTEERSRLGKDDDDISVLPSSPILQRTAAAAVSDAGRALPSDDASPLIGGLQVAQKRRALRTGPAPAVDSAASRQTGSDPVALTAVASPSGSAALSALSAGSSAAPGRQSVPADTDCGGGDDCPPSSSDASLPPTVQTATVGGQSPPKPPDTSQSSEPPGDNERSAIGSPVLYYVDYMGHRQQVAQSERAGRLLAVLSDSRSPEENVQRVMKFLALEGEQTAVEKEKEPWPDDVLPTRGFQESSLPAPLDPTKLDYLPPSVAERESSPVATSTPAPVSAPAPGLITAATPSSALTMASVTSSITPEPAESAGDSCRQHSRASRLLQHSIGAQAAKKSASAAHKLSLKLAARQRCEETPAMPEVPASRPPAQARDPPLLPPLPTGTETGPLSTAGGRRRAASPADGAPAAMEAKQARRVAPARDASEEIRPAPLRLARRPPPGQAERAMVPPATRLKTPGALTGPGSAAASSSSSSEDDSAGPAVARRTAADQSAGPSSSGGARPQGDVTRPGAGSRPVDVSPGGGATDPGAGSRPVDPSPRGGATGDADDECRIACPLCGAFFAKDEIEVHASQCDGPDVMEIEQCPSPPLRRCTTRGGRERTPGGQQRCHLCGEMVDEGPQYLEHVGDCVRRRNQLAAAGREATPDRAGAECLPSGGTELDSDERRPASSAATAQSPTFQRISVQTNSFIDYSNQFRAAATSAGGRRRPGPARGRRRKGGGRGRRGGRTS